MKEKILKDVGDTVVIPDIYDKSKDMTGVISMITVNKKGIKYVLSFDGIRGDKEYETGLPKELYVKKFLLASGNSSFKKVMDKSNEQVYEALYLNW